MPAAPITNALTIDVEDYFQVSAFAPHIARSEWSTRECRVERNVNAILEMLSSRDIKATFFTLGWIAERYPQLVRQIVKEGHELASHGYGHERASDQTEAAFFADIHLAKIVLEDLADSEISGYRAPSFSIGTANLWAFDCLVRGRLPLQLQHLPHPARPLRHARLAAVRSRGAARLDGNSDHDFADAEPQLAVQRRGLLQTIALCPVALDARPGQ